MSAPTEGKAESVDNNSESIKLKVVGQDSNEIHFRVKLTTLFYKVKKKYSKLVGVQVGRLRFRFYGGLIKDMDTPKLLEMENDDVINVFQNQIGVSAPTEGKAESGDNNSEYIKLKFLGQDSNEIHFRAKLTTKFGKMKKSYSERVGIQVWSLRFLFDGRRIEDTDTPRLLEMENDDVIYVFQEQRCGGSFWAL